MEQLTRRMADRSLELGGQDGNHVDRPHPRVELERGGDGGLASLTAAATGDWRRSPRQRIRASRGDQPLGQPVVDVVEPVVEPAATIELDGCLQ